MLFTKVKTWVIKLNCVLFFTKFEISKLKGLVLRADFRPKPCSKQKLATSWGSSSKREGLREKSFQILNHAYLR